MSDTPSTKDLENKEDYYSFRSYKGADMFQHNWLMVAYNTDDLVYFSVDTLHNIQGEVAISKEQATNLRDYLNTILP